MDIVVGHGVKLGRQIQVIRDSARFPNCKWVQVVHTAPEVKQNTNQKLKFANLLILFSTCGTQTERSILFIFTAMQDS